MKESNLHQSFGSDVDVLPDHDRWLQRASGPPTEGTRTR